MIDIDLIRQNLSLVKESLRKRGADERDADRLLEVDRRWRSLIQRVDELRAQQNEANDKISAAAADERAALIEAVRSVAGNLKAAEQELKEITHERDHLWRVLPNLVTEDVPKGGEKDFELIRAVPEQTPDTPAYVRNYLDLYEPELVDLERAGKVSGTGFVYLKGQLARLQLGLVSLAMDRLSNHGFTPIIPPVLIHEGAMDGMGYLTRHADEIYRVQDDLYLVGTSEQSVGPMHADEVLQAEHLPLRYVAYSPCFRREAGSHGKDVRGMLRVHQFDKVEMFSFTTPDQSEAEHLFLLERQEELMQALELPYRVIKLAAGDLGAPAAKTYDIETWMPSEGRYRETHSTSNTTDYQARRLNIRAKVGEETVKAHLLNGTAFAIGRTFIALLENHQQEDGSVRIPAALRNYVPFERIALTEK